MPFLEHFGLQDYPFGLTPNADLYYPAKDTDAILDALDFAIRRGDGLLKVVGEVGTGKTLLCRLLLKRMEGQAVNMAYLSAPITFQPNQLLLMIAHEFGLKIKTGDIVSKLRDFLVKEHGKGKRNVLVIDEAQAFAAEGLETIRLLSNLETETDKLLQIVLFGQPELDELLGQTNLRQLLQRVQFGFGTKPLSREMVADYVRFRLAGCASTPKKTKASKNGKSKEGIKRAPVFKQIVPCARFDSKAITLLARASGGLPRLINTLADKALLAAYAEGQTNIDSHHVRIACRETQGLAFPWSLFARFY